MQKILETKHITKITRNPNKMLIVLNILKNTKKANTKYQKIQSLLQNTSNTRKYAKILRILKIRRKTKILRNTTEYQQYSETPANIRKIAKNQY